MNDELLFEEMTQVQLMQKMFAQMMVMDQKMASKKDIDGMEKRMTNKLEHEVQNLKTDQQQLRSQVEERIQQFEEKQKEEEIAKHLNSMADKSRELDELRAAAIGF